MKIFIQIIRVISIIVLCLGGIFVGFYGFLVATSSLGGNSVGYSLKQLDGTFWWSVFFLVIIPGVIVFLCGRYLKKKSIESVKVQNPQDVAQPKGQPFSKAGAVGVAFTVSVVIGALLVFGTLIAILLRMAGLL